MLNQLEFPDYNSLAMIISMHMKYTNCVGEVIYELYEAEEKIVATCGYGWSSEAYINRFPRTPYGLDLTCKWIQEIYEHLINHLSTKAEA